MIVSLLLRPIIDGLRDYGIEGQIGLEKTLDEYINKMLLITAELKRVLKKTGTMWWDHGDSYGGSGMGVTYSGHTKGPNSILPDKVLASMPKVAHTRGIYEKSLLLQNYRLAQNMVDRQKWILRNVIVWWKPNCMPSSVRDRFTSDWEPVFFFSKSAKYWFEPQYEAYHSAEDRWGGEEYKGANKGAGRPEAAGLDRSRNLFNNPLGRNKRTVWKIPTQPYKEAHFAVFPEKLIETPIKAGCPEFICKKCGKARESIFEPSEEYQKLLGKSWHDHSADLQHGMTVTSDKKVSVVADYRKIGYTDCGCNAGFRGGIVLDPFLGSGTTAVVAKKLGRNFIGIELNKDYIKMAEKRLVQQVLI